MKDTRSPVTAQNTSEFMPDTMTAKINNLKILVTPDGKVLREDCVYYFNIRSKLNIEQLYFYNYENDIISIYTETDYDVAGSVAKRINIAFDSIIWEAIIPGFNLAKPVFINNKAYLSSIGFVGKLDLNTGNYDWQFVNLFKDGKYNSFGQPKFFKPDLILFTSKEFSTGRLDSILIEDNKGIILKMN